MTTLIGFRCKRGNTFSREVLIARVRNHLSGEAFLILVSKIVTKDSIVLVVCAAGGHLFPFRTQQLSPPAPMVLHPWGVGRVGRRQDYAVFLFP